jgi:hypothetical protein
VFKDRFLEAGKREEVRHASRVCKTCCRGGNELNTYGSSMGCALEEAEGHSEEGNSFA